MELTAFLAMLLTAPFAAQHPDPAADHAAIRQALLDYGEGFYDHAPERVTRAVSPLLSKRALVARPGVPPVLVQMNAEMLIEATRGSAPRPAATERNVVVEVLDVSGSIASARLFSVQFNDYVHLVKRDNRWTILNVLWHAPVAAPSAPAGEAVARAAGAYASALATGDPGALLAVTSAVANLRTLSPSLVVLDRNLESTAAALTAGSLPKRESEPAVSVLGTDGDIASVKVGTGPAVTYLHLALQNGKWLVVNTLNAAPSR